MANINTALVTDAQTFESAQFGKVRVIMINDEPWFIGNNVTDALGYTNSRKALADHVDDEDKADVTIRYTSSNGVAQNRTVTAISESGVYSLVFSSKLPTAKLYKRWVTSEVLPAIRKHGAYMTPAVIEQALLNPDTIIRLATELKAEREKVVALEGKIESDRPKVIFSDAVTVSHTSILIGDMAKLLKQNGVEMGQKRLFAWLREHGFLIKRKGADWNMPTQRSMEMGLFEIKESVVAMPDGATRINKTPKVTGKGQVYFTNVFLDGKEKADPEPQAEVEVDVTDTEA